MLTDIERKTLRILSNFSTIRRRLPTINELCIKTGRTPEGIKKVLATLEKERYIDWDSMFPDVIHLLEAWERIPLLPTKRYNSEVDYTRFMD